MIRNKASIATGNERTYESYSDINPLLTILFDSWYSSIAIPFREKQTANKYYLDAMEQFNVSQQMPNLWKNPIMCRRTYRTFDQKLYKCRRLSIIFARYGPV